MNAWRHTSANGRTLLLTVLLTGLTTFMFLPLLAIQLSAVGMPAGRVGLLVGLLSFSGQTFSLISGLIVDRFPARTVLAAGFGLRIAGYVLLGLGITGRPGLGLLVPGILGIGIGGSLLGLSIKTRLVQESGDDPRGMLALRSTFVNVGVVAGPALGALAYPFGFPYILAACVCSHLILGLLLTARTPRPAAPGTPAAAGPGAAGPAEPGKPWARRHWVLLFLLGTAYWTVYSQLNVVMPLTAQRLTGSTAAISVVFTVNGVLCVLFQYVLIRRVFHHATSRTLLRIGFLAFALAYAVFLPLTGWPALLLFVLPVTLAEMLISPSLDDQAVRAGSSRRTGLTLGAMGAAAAVGSLLGSSGGGYLLQVLHGGPALWITISGVAVVAAAASHLLPKGPVQHATAQRPHRRADPSPGDRHRRGPETRPESGDRHGSARAGATGRRLAGDPDELD
ncbi:MFS transporter [Actinoplanes sp. NPDC051851]|uniref:MFS transporter n=1 Tax=Actinoplanes sp. NPDC051851 TaxID=3154753 RepID=UPI003425BE18